jgi:acetyl-CoA acetyltransferase
VFKRARIVGAFESERRKADVHPFAIFEEVITAALEDAGLTLSEVDGLCVTAGDVAEGGSSEDVIEIAEYLGITPTFFDSTDIGGCSAIYQTGVAAAAIEAGLADVVVVAYAAAPRRFPFFPPITWETGPGAHEMPYGYASPSAYALFAQRHMHEFGTTSAQLARIAVTARSNAALNPHALMRDPLSVDDVLASPMVSSPLRKLDCCVVTDSGGAVVLTSNERARDLKKRPVRLLGFGSQITRVHFSQQPDFTVTPGVVSGRLAFGRAGLSPADVSVAQLYDAFTITPLLALEDLGFCRKGEGGPFVESGAIDPTGSIPINTDGGGLSSNHPGKRGVFALIEGVRQLRGEGPGYQVTDPQVSLVHGIGGFFSAATTVLMAND